MAVADTIGRAVLAHRAFPHRHREELAACVDGQAVAGRMHAVSVQVIGGSDELARRLRAMRRHVDVDARCPVARGVEQPDFGAALVNDARAIGLRIARVVDVVVGVPPHVGAVGPARIEVAHALRVRKKIDALADPHRAGQVSGELRQAAERSAPRRVDPQMARGAAAVAFPARGIGGVAADDLRVARPEGEVIDLAVRQHFRQPAVDTQRECAIVAEERLPMRRDEQDPPLRRPAAHEHIGPKPRHAPRGTARRGHQVNLGVLLVAADVRDPLAVRRQRRRGRFTQSCGQAARRAAAFVDAPEIIVADEGDGVATNCGLTQIATLGHEFDSLGGTAESRS